MSFSLLINFLVFVVSLGGLIIASDRLLALLGTLGKRWGISAAVLAFVIVAIGTSLPELTSSIVAVRLHDTELAIANLFGSNLTNSLLIGGLVVLFAGPVLYGDEMIKKRNLMLVCAVIPVLLIMFVNIWISIFALFALGIFVIWYLIQSGDGEIEEDEVLAGKIKGASNTRVYLQAVAWLVLMVVAGFFTVKSVENIGASLGMSATLIGVVFLAFGTSLPELVTSYIAIRRKEVEVAVATLFGSNVINITLLLAITFVASPDPIVVPKSLLMLTISAAVSCFVLGFGLSAKKSLRVPVSVGFFALYGVGIFLSS